MPTDRTADQLHLREGYFPVPGAQLYFREVGNDGLPLVILHGGRDFNHNYLLPDLDRLSGTFHLIYYDQRGRGKSSRGVAPEAVNIKSEVDDLDRLRHHFGLDTIAVLGHSWGGVLAMEYPTCHSDHVSHLILLNAAPASLRGSDHLEGVVRRLRSHFTPQDILKARAIGDRLYAQTWLSPEYDQPESGHGNLERCERQSGGHLQCGG